MNWFLYDRNIHPESANKTDITLNNFSRYREAFAIQLVLSKVIWIYVIVSDTWMFLSLISQYLEARTRIWITSTLSADNNFSLHVRMIAPLAFASAYVIKLFDDLAQLIRNVFGQDANDILDCFQDNYIGRIRHNTQRIEPLLPIEIWSMFNRTNEDLHRTNHVVEGWFRWNSSSFIPKSKQCK